MNKLDFLTEKINKLNTLYKKTYLNKIQEITSFDFLFTFSKNKNESLFISLNTQNPFIDSINFKSKDSFNSLFLNSLKSKLIQGMFEEASLFNNDSIVDLYFIKTTDTYEKKHYHLLIELFKGNPNLILLENNKIVLAFKYHSLETNHPIIPNTIYIPLTNNFILKEIDINKENEKINLYINSLNEKHLKEKYNSLINQLKRKKKSLDNKIKGLNEDKEKALNNLKYKDYADYYLTIMEEIEKGQKYFTYEDKKIPLKENYSKNDNLQYLYKVYKKAKATLKVNEDFLKEAIEESNYITSILETKEFLNEDDYLELIKELDSKKIIKINKNIKVKEIKAIHPYYFEYDGVKIGFGKNNLQNNELTFKLAKKDNYYFHILNYHGSHVILFSDNLTDDLLEICLETVLYLSKKESIDVLVSKVKDVKKAPTLGLCNCLKYESYHINKCRDEVKNLINNANRFLH